MPDKLQKVGEILRDTKEGLSEEDFVSTSHHAGLEHKILWVRNIAVAIAVLLFLLSLLHVPHANFMKAIAYFLGSGAYFCEILILTDCFRERVPHHEMFMAYCFGPMYILLGISYLFH